MEPSSTLQYTKDTLQELSEEMTTLQTLVDRACDDASAASSDLSNQLHNLQNSVTSSRSAIENLLKQAADGLSISSQTVKTDLTQFKQNLKDTTGDASAPNATKQPDGAIIDPATPSVTSPAAARRRKRLRLRRRSPPTPPRPSSLP